MSRKQSVAGALALVAGLVLGARDAAAASEPSLTRILSSLGFTNRAETDRRRFPPGTYDVQLLAEFTGGHAAQAISWYPAGSSDFTLLFSGAEGGAGLADPQPTRQFLSTSEFGLSLKASSGNRFFTESSRNPGHDQQVRVFVDRSTPGAFLIGFEDQRHDDTDPDFQDVVLRLTPSPTRASDAFDKTIELCTRELSSAVHATFKDAFDEQISQPILAGLQYNGADPETIAVIARQLEHTKGVMAQMTSAGVEGMLDGRLLLGGVQRSLDDSFRLPAVLPSSVEVVTSALGQPVLSPGQSIDDILRDGLNPALIEFTWDDITAKFRPHGNDEPQILYKEVTVGAKAEASKGADKKGEKPAKVKLTVTAEVKTSSNTSVEVATSGSVDTSGAREGTVSVGFKFKF
jgi:hypothetical protein